MGNNVDQPVGAHPVRLWVGALQHPSPQVVALLLVQLPVRTRPRAVMQPCQALGVIAHHSITQRLPLPPDQTSRLSPACPFQCLGDRQGAQCCAPIRLAARKPAQVRGVKIAPDRQPTSRHQALPRIDQIARESHDSASVHHIRVSGRDNGYETLCVNVLGFWSVACRRVWPQGRFAPAQSPVARGNP